MKKKFYYKKPLKQKPTTLEKIVRILLFGSFFSFLFATFLSGFPIFVYLWNIISPSTNEYLSGVLSDPITVQEKTINKNLDEKIVEYIPPKKDPSLPLTPEIRINKIGINTNILEQPRELYEEALKNGVWRVPNFGNPMQRDFPIILVAHRFGYVSWSQEYRLQNSFYNLPDLNPGDKVELIWDQRKFEYEIYQSEEGTDITQYNADLILYTCKFLKSDVRIFKYAKLIES